MKRFALALVLLTVLSAACTEEAKIQEREYPLVRTFFTSDDESITFTGEIMSKGSQEIISYGFVFETQHQEQVDTILFIGKPAENFNITLQSGFAPGVMYHFRAFIQTSEHCIYGNRLDFMFNDSKPVELYRYYPIRGTTGDTIVIEGKFFSRLSCRNIVMFGSDTAKVIIAEDDKLYVKVPETPKDQICQISVKTPSSFSSFEGNFERWYNWSRIIDSVPGTYQRGTKAGQYVILFDYWDKTTMVTNINTGLSNFATQFPGSGYTYYDPVFSCEDKAYFLCNGSNQLWQYIPQTGEWIRKQDVPTPLEPYSKPIVIESIAYFIDSNNDSVRLWAYNAIDDAWTFKKNLTGSHFYPVASFAAGNKGYFGCNESGIVKVYEFDPVTSTIKHLSDYPGQGKTNLAGFFIDGKIYLGLGYYESGIQYLAKDLWELNTMTLKWQESFSFPDYEGYKGCQINIFSEDGYVTRNYYSFNKTEIYKFDPLKQ